jgi:hypothetical protein
MLSKEFIVETITRDQLENMKEYLRYMYGFLNIETKFPTHFLDRVNDERNGKPISIEELTRLFQKEYEEHGDEIKRLPRDSQVVLRDLLTKISVPIAIDKNPKTKASTVFGKTAMRKDNFATNSMVLKVE